MIQGRCVVITQSVKQARRFSNLWSLRSGKVTSHSYYSHSKRRTNTIEGSRCDKDSSSRNRASRVRGKTVKIMRAAHEQI